MLEADQAACWITYTPDTVMYCDQEYYTLTTVIMIQSIWRHLTAILETSKTKLGEEGQADEGNRPEAAG